MSEDLYNQFIAEGFERVERDDRLLDVFPDETREKGVELWDKWAEDTVEIIRLHLPRGEKGMSRHIFQCHEIEAALSDNKAMDLGVPGVGVEPTNP